MLRSMQRNNRVKRHFLIIAKVMKKMHKNNTQLGNLTYWIFHRAVKV